MRLEINDTLAEMRQQLRGFVTARLHPVAAEIDRTGQVPDAAWDLMRDQGLLGMLMPAQYGGMDADLQTYCIAQEELGRSHRVFTLILDYTSGLCPTGILKLGTEAQREKWLPGLASGRLRASFGLTEPDAGSDAAAMKTRATKAPGGWVLNGRKHWISGANKADVIMLMAVTDPEKRARGGITAFLLEKGTPGFEVTRVDTTIGSEAIELAELTFTDCELPESAVVGEVGAGFKVAMKSLNDGRLSVSCSCVGAAESLLDMATEHVKVRKTFGKLLAERQAIQWMLVESATDIAAGRALAYDVLRRLEAGKNIGSAGSMCKLFCSEMVGRVADRAVQIHGGMGVIRGFPVERFYRDVRHYRVGEGASEIQKIVIARDLLRGVDIGD